MNELQSRFQQILFVDDEPGVLKAMQRLFQDEPYEIHTASRGCEALKLLQKTGTIQLVISDYRMLVELRV